MNKSLVFVKPDDGRAVGAHPKRVILPALGDLSKYSDGGKVQRRAKNAMSWATGLGTYQRF